MNIKEIGKGEWCHYCHQEFNGVEEGFVEPIESGEALYHLRCLGKLVVYRIEGVLPKHLFTAITDELKNPLPLSLTDKEQTTLNDYEEE